MNKMTKKVALSYAVAVISNAETPKLEGFTQEDVVNKLNDMLAQLDKKPAGEKGMTETQKQNVGYKEEIENLLSDGKARMANEILNEVPAFVENKLSNQRVSALLRQLILDNKVKKEVVKGKSYFSVA